MEHVIGASIIRLTQGDITECDTDAIVNAANEQLVLGAGVAGAIRNKGGPSIQEACDAIRHCPTGHAVITGSGNLKARFVIHAVGPRQGEGEASSKLKNATLESLKRAEETQLASLTFPAISTGIYRFPVNQCAQIMLPTVMEFLKTRTGITLVQFCLFDSSTFEVFTNTLADLTKESPSDKK